MNKKYILVFYMILVLSNINAQDTLLTRNNILLCESVQDYNNLLILQNSKIDSVINYKIKKCNNKLKKKLIPLSEYSTKMNNIIELFHETDLLISLLIEKEISFSQDKKYINNDSILIQNYKQIELKMDDIKTWVNKIKICDNCTLSKNDFNKIYFIKNRTSLMFDYNQIYKNYIIRMLLKTKLEILELNNIKVLLPSSILFPMTKW